MTVKELIAELEKFDSDLEVYTTDDFFGEPSSEIYDVRIGKIKTFPVIEGKITTGTQKVLVVS